MAVRFSCSSLYSQNVLTTKQTQNIYQRAELSPWRDCRGFFLVCLVVVLGWVLVCLWVLLNFVFISHPLP